MRISWDEALDHAQTFTSMDPRTTNLGKESDIHLAVKGDTDATLAMCDVVIKNGRKDWSTAVASWRSTTRSPAAPRSPTSGTAPTW